jgi:hypothetical protein
MRVLVAFLLTASAAQAATLVTGGVQFPATAEPSPGGSVEFSTSEAFSGPTASGLLISKVLSGDTSNPLGGLTFTYQLTLDAGDFEIARLQVADFTGLSIDASYVSGSGTAPTATKRGTSGSAIDFSFINGVLHGGSSSTVLVVQTSATSYQQTMATLVTPSLDTVGSLAPVAVPEPGSWLLAVLGMPLIWRRR